MDALSKELDSYLTRLGHLRVLVDHKKEGYIRNLLFLLPLGHDQIIAEYYGILGVHQAPLDDIARRHNMTPADCQALIERDLRRIAVTPEWQVIKG